MKVFDLLCERGHRFEGWFASAGQFTAQCDAGDVRCPLCDSGDVHRSPSAPRLNLAGEVGDRTVAPPDAAIARFVSGMRRAVAATENVGDRFAEEARRIHYEETPPRAIRGTATASEKRALDDEGIETLSIRLPLAVTETLQ